MTDGDVEPTDLTLDEILTAASQEVPGVARRDEETGSSWLVGAEAFASVSGSRAWFRLDPLVAGAALRTPDTSPSTQGPDWVAYEPAVLDIAAVDRAEAWFLSAARRASRGGPPRNR